MRDEATGGPAAGEVITLTIDSDPVLFELFYNFTPEKAAGMPKRYRPKGVGLFVEPDFGKRRG